MLACLGGDCPYFPASGGKLYNVPLSAIYRNAADKAHTPVTQVPRAELKARASAEGEGGAETR